MSYAVVDPGARAIPATVIIYHEDANPSMCIIDEPFNQWALEHRVTNYLSSLGPLRMVYIVRDLARAQGLEQALNRAGYITELMY